ncbi:alpha/beta hydrolase family protein [Marinicella litoralis]|uniref:Prolyl oligopeptidase family protein n=1 Tax=Marinicella litoralis TaxID=644220 RepID=A0A4R6XZQ5_9GAMM|nr:prolyl oligopeptidase family serine peptidase [Marinicella litoralis]TDR23283.1 prolyl oligopeptidase family protein [Marinicella litoralis]
MKNKFNRTILTHFAWVFIAFYSFPLAALKFNEKELIVLHGDEKALAADEGYLYLSVDSENHFTTVVLDRVGSGKRLRFTDMAAGENHALIQLEAGIYYWKSIRGYLLFGLNWFHFDEDDYYFEVKPGVVNYPGTWQSNFKLTGLLQGYLSIKATNKATIEWPYFKQTYSQYTGQTPFEYVGHTEDYYNTYLEALIDKYDFKARQKIDYQNTDKSNLPVKYFDIDDGVELQKKQFPLLSDYLDSDDQISGEINPQGEWILLSSKQHKETMIEVVNIKTLKSYVVFKENLPARARIRHLQWIDNDSFLFDIDYEKYSFSQVLHLETNDNNELTRAHSVELPMAGSVLSPLVAQDNHMVFANHKMSDVGGKSINGVYLVDTSTSKTVKKSFKKKLGKTKRFDRVIDWLTDASGVVRSAIEVEYDEKAEQVLFHHWFLTQKGTDDWVKIKTSYADDEIPLPVKLSEDETFFYAFSDQYGDKKSVHKYSVKDYSYIGPFYEDSEVEINGLIEDPTTHQIIGYTYMENGLSKRKFFNEKNDRIKALRAKNPQIQLYVRQHLADAGLMLIYGTTQFSKGAWYLFQQNNGQIIKLLDESPVYEKLPKGDNFSLKITAEDGVDIEGYLVVPSLRGDDKPPLVVIPHGGPIGVRDTANNDEMQHFFASKGIATLKVNYRGSSGYGKQFKEMGNQQWGEKIESDIHSMVLHAAKTHDLNLNKVCAMGGSYGGYSAVMLTVLYPDVYQCAVSLHGVMDLPLLFANDSMFKDDEFYARLAEIVGDPKTDLDRLIQKSPFYLAEKITKPIKLFHGVNDERVTLEHSFRMQQMFTILKMNADLTLLMDEGHSMKYLNSNIFYVAESLKFIIKHLDLPIKYSPDDDQELIQEDDVIDYILD